MALSHKPEINPSKTHKTKHRLSRHFVSVGYTVDAQATEVAIGVHALNRMLDLGRPDSVRVR